MKCPYCGAKIEKRNAKFCESCGQALPKRAARRSRKQTVAMADEFSSVQDDAGMEMSGTRTVELKCKSCGGPLNYTPGSNVLVCPYCGSTEILEESDAVKIEKIRSSAYKEVELHRQRMMEKRREEEERLSFKKTRSFKAAVFLTVICLFGALMGFAGGAPYSGIIALIQIVLLVLAFLLGFGVLKPKFRNMHKLFIIAAAVLIFVFIGLANEPSYTRSSATTEIEWEDLELSEVLPVPDNELGRVYSDSTSRLSVEMEPYTKSQFKEYVTECKELGFTIDAQASNERSYNAYNEEGYRIDLYWFESDNYMSLTLNAPIVMSPFVWPSNGISGKLPAPESSTGKIVSDSNGYFSAYVGDTDKTAYMAYTSACMDAGFKVDYYRSDTYFSGKNEDGIQVYIDYEGFGTMYIRIYAPND